MSSFPLTNEQLSILEACEHLKDGETLKINAFAGTGKTTTLVAINNHLPDKTFLYLAFNSSIVKEAKKKFNNNVTVVTTHSLALGYILNQNKSFPENSPLYKVKNDDGYKKHDLVEILDVNEDIAFDVLKILSRYSNSTHTDIKKCAFEVHLKNPMSVFHAERFYEMMKNREIEITHDFYLKEFSLYGDFSQYKFDYILLDEGQDTNSVVLNIFDSLSGAKIIVGDTHQTIYQFRGSVNAMETIKSKYTFYLSTTFRCVPDVVADANYVLKNFKNEKVPLVSKASKKEIKNCGYITRTNSQIIFLISRFDEFNLYKDVDELFTPAIQIHYFLNKQFDFISKKYSFLKEKKTRAELVSYIEEYEDIELLSALKVAEIFKGYLLVLRKKAKEKHSKKAKNIFITAHKSKGLEFDSVVLEKDFRNLSSIENKDKLIEESNLLYVAITRAKYQITYLGEYHNELFKKAN